MGEISIVDYFSSHDGYKCGYCKSENTCYSHGMWADTLTPLDYQNLIDRGWRRSGKYVYKPTLHLTCCPQYTIRCEAKKFSLSRSQKKVSKKVNKFLMHGEKAKNASSESAKRNDDIMEDSNIHEAMDVQILRDMKDISKISRSDTDIIDSPNHTATDSLPKQEIPVMLSSPCPMSSSFISSHTNESTSITSNKSNPDKPCRKAKELRRERKLQKLLSKGIPADEALSSIQKKGKEPKSIEDFLNENFPSEPMHKLELRLVPANFQLDEFRSTYGESYSMYQKYQKKIHNDRDEDCDEDSFRDFLVEMPFKRLDSVSAQTINYGAYHHQYWLDGKLIAVGVIDILPYCVSSVYFYYDPDYSFLSLGTYAALREIALTRELNKIYPNLQYYYMGFYIHSCVKMRYKGQYDPSYLLCPETYIFQSIEKCLPKLDISKYHRLEEDPDKEDCDGIVNLQEVLILHNRRKYTYQSYSKVRKEANDEELVREYAGFVGKKCYRKILLYRS